MRMTWRPAALGHLPRDTRDTWFLLAVIGWIVLMQTPQVPVWCTGLTLGVLAWRAWLAWRQRPLPGWPWRLALLTIALGATWATHRTVLGQDAGVTLIVLLLALKTLELRARRDAFVVFFLGFFTLLTHFFHSQSLLTALGIVVALMGLLSALVNAHMPVGYPSLWHTTRLAGGMVLLGTPIMVLLFVLFPRFAPLWGLPTDSTLGRSGLSGQMQVGQIAQLALDDSIAFRVEFPDGQRPQQPAMYFRGPVLSDFDGMQWRPRTPLPSEAPDARWTTTGPPVRYRVTMEPSRQPWVLTLEATAALPPILGQPPRLSPALEWTAIRPITDLLRFEAQAFLEHRHGPTERTLALQRDLELPPGYNPRTLQLAQDLQRALGPQRDTTAYVRAVLDRLSTGGYRYTLEPGLYGRHTADEFWFDRKAGFCEHIASSFVILMRALDIPARVVTGYQGGALNPVDQTWTVRQSDAHAWAEIWQPGQGWVRIDPTAYVMPDRTGTTERLRPPPGLMAQTLIRMHPALLTQIRALWDATNHRWNQWVLNYTQSRQLDLLKRLGFQHPNWTDLFHLMAGVFGAFSLAVAGWLIWRRQHRDPWLRMLDRARHAVMQSGRTLPPNATPRQLAQVLCPPGQPPLPEALPWQAWLMAMEAWRYDPDQPDRNLHRLQAQWRQLPRIPSSPL